MEISKFVQNLRATRERGNRTQWIKGYNVIQYLPNEAYMKIGNDEARLVVYLVEYLVERYCR